MAIIIPSSIPSKASQGEKRFFSILTSKLPDSFYVWYEPRLTKSSLHPDFIILAPNFGLLIIEIKGWFPKNIISATSDRFEIRIQKEEYENTSYHKSPLRQAKDYLDSLLNQLQEYRILRNIEGKYQGKLAFPIGWGAIMSNISETQAENINLKTVLPTPQVAYSNELLNWEKEDFSTFQLIKRLQLMFTVKFPFSPLTQEQINTIRGIIYPEIIIKEENAKINHVPANFPLLSDDKILITLDHKQENLAKNIGDGHRIFFGVAGSGKTLLLMARAKLLINRNPDTKILILCFNISLASYLKSILHEDKNNPQYKKIKVYNFDEWAKIILGKLPAKVEGNRDEYTAKLLLEKLSLMDDENKWDAIFIDEAHTFVPSWFKCCLNALKDKENGDLMIVADGSQSLYKRDDFTWKEVGIKAQGRTISRKFDLNKNYRNTIEVVNCAWSVFREIQKNKEVLEAEEVIFPIIQPEFALRSGDKPFLYLTNTLENQENLIINNIQQLIDNDSINPDDIAILYRQQNGDNLSRIMDKLNQKNIPFYWVTKSRDSRSKYSHKKEGVRLITCLSSLGLEFKIVFIIWLEQFEDCLNNNQGALMNIRQLYVAMTRAKEGLFLFGLDDSKFVHFLSNNENLVVIKNNNLS